MTDEPKRSKAAIWVPLVVLAAVVLVILGVQALGGDGESSLESDTAAQALVDPRFEACVQAWNVRDGMARSMGASNLRNMSGVGEVYMSIGPQVDYPDQCIFTMALPALDTTTQFTGSVNGGDWTVINSPKASQLHESIKNWNVEMTEAGELVVLDR